MKTLISPQGSVATMPDDLAETLLRLGWTEPGRRAAEAEGAAEPEVAVEIEAGPEARPKSRRR